MAMTTLAPEQIGEIFTAGVAKDLEEILKRHLHQKLDHIIDDFAVELAKQIAVRVQSVVHRDPLSGDNKILLNVEIDRKKIASVEMVPQVTKA